GDRLDAELVGTSPGAIVAVDEDLPAERFSEELAGPTSFRVLVKDVKTLRLPDADDAFAKTASEFDTMEELRADLREKIHEAKEHEAAGVIRDRVLQALIDTVQVDLPDSLVQDETSHRLVHAEENAGRHRVSLRQ